MWETENFLAEEDTQEEFNKDTEVSFCNEHTSLALDKYLRQIRALQ